MSEEEVRSGYSGALKKMHEATQTASQALRASDDLRTTNDDLRGRLGEVEKQVTDAQKKSIFDDEEFMESVRNDPAEGVKFYVQQNSLLRAEIAEILKEHTRRV